MPRILLLLALLLVAAQPARAQMASYCNGDVVADLFDTQVVVGPAGRATYTVRLRNTRPQARRLVVNVAASFLGRPFGPPISLPPNSTTLVPLGYQPRLPGSIPLRNQELAGVTRVSCV